MHAEVRGGGGGNAAGIQSAGERENTDQGGTDGGNVIHQTNRGGRRKHSERREERKEAASGPGLSNRLSWSWIHLRGAQTVCHSEFNKTDLKETQGGAGCEKMQIPALIKAFS